MRQLIWCAAIILTGCNDGPLAFTTMASTPTTGAPTAPAGGNSAPSQSLVTLQNLVRTKDSGGDIRILGEAVTSSSNPLTFIKAACTFKDASGVVLGTDTTYIVGRVVKITSINSNTNTALRTGDTGYFDLLTSINDAAIASYNCVPSFNPSSSTTPSARLEIEGTPTVTSNSIGDVMYMGSAKNTGSKPLIFGKVFAATLSKAGALLDVSFGYVDGQTAIITVGTTDTGLDIEQIGPFSVSTLAPFSSRATTIYLYDWQDVDALSTPAAGLVGTKKLTHISYENMHAMRNDEIAHMESRLNNSN